MIPPPFKDRFLGDSGVDIATQEIDAIFPDGEKRRVVLRVGAPFQKDGATCIRTEIENLDRTDGPIFGEGSFHALVLGISFIVKRLEIFERKHGCRYCWTDTDDAFDYHTIFSTTK